MAAVAPLVTELISVCIVDVLSVVDFFRYKLKGKDLTVDYSVNN